MAEKIYALYRLWNDQPQYFYVGRTNDPERRLAEHRRAARNPQHREDVYCYIREHLQPCGIDIWDMEVLVTEETARPEDNEDFWVVLMIRAGYDLKNMRHGDLHRVALEFMARARPDQDFKTVDEFIEFRAAVEKEQREAYERSRQLKQSILEETANPRLDVQEFLKSLQEQQETLQQRRRKEQAEQAEKQRQRDEKFAQAAAARETRLRAETEQLMREEQERRWKEFYSTQAEYEQECVRRQLRDSGGTD
jgi:predicted GIY-YIG superfamily endonuclease